MPFDISTAVELDESREVIPTTKFDFSSAQELNANQTKSTPSISGFLRELFQYSLPEVIETQVEKNKIKKKNPNITPEQLDLMMEKRERDIIEQGVLRQVEAPMTLAVGVGLATAPLTTAAAVGAFTIKDHFFNARKFVEEKNPNASLMFKDFVEILDLAATGAVIGAGTGKVKGFIKRRVENLNIPRSVNVLPEQIEKIKTKPEITDSLGITQEHIDASLSSGTPVAVPLERFVDLAMKKEWDGIKLLFGMGKEKIKNVIASEKPKQSAQIEQKPISQLEQEKILGSSEPLGSEKLDLQKTAPLIQSQEQKPITEIISLEKSDIAPGTSTSQAGNIQPQEVGITQYTKPLEGLASNEIVSRERGFVKSVKESEMVTKETKSELRKLPEEVTQYDVYTDIKAVEKAKERIKNNPEESLSYVLSSESLDKEITTTGIELMRRYREQGNIEQEVNVATNLAEKGTKAGQFIQAYSI